MLRTSITNITQKLILKQPALRKSAPRVSCRGVTTRTDADPTIDVVGKTSKQPVWDSAVAYPALGEQSVQINFEQWKRASEIKVFDTKAEDMMLHQRETYPQGLVEFRGATPLAPWPNKTNPYTGEVGGPKGLEPTRFGDWERLGICVDF